MRKRILYFGMLTCIIGLFLYTGCRKDGGYYEDQAIVRAFSGNTYEFLKSKNAYDSFLFVVDRVGLTDSLKSGNYTVFAPTDNSFKSAMSNLNRLRAIQSRPLQSLASVPLKQLDTLVARYIIRGVIPSDSMINQDGTQLYTILFGYPMHGKRISTNAEGFVEGGPKIIQFSDTKGSIYTRQWTKTETVTTDIKTSNGYVDVLDRSHEFGFGEFIQRVNPTFSLPYFGVPLTIPGTIGLNHYDIGGERVAYHDDDASNNGGDYRPKEGVDIRTADGGDNGYSVGWCNPKEWMNYTVNIAKPGKYRMILRGSSPRGDATLHLELDHKRLTGAIRIKNTLGYSNYDNIETIVDFPVAGRHVLRMVYDYAAYDLRFMVFLPLNGEPYPIPGTIPVVGFNSGGEGIGYHDNDASNNGGRFRLTEGVDIEQTSELGGYDVGWTGDDEWLNYTVDVKKTGQYKLSVRVGSPSDPNGGHRFHVEMDGTNISGTMVCPNTGGWQSWTDVTTTVYLERGVHTMRFYLETGGYNIRSYTFSAIN